MVLSLVNCPLLPLYLNYQVYFDLTFNDFSRCLVVVSRIIKSFPDLAVTNEGSELHQELATDTSPT